jgi:Flp pilus assembly protein TadG
MIARKIVHQARRHRRGVAAMLFAFLLPVLVGFVGLSVDSGVLALARGQLSTAADSAALAGARQLASDRRVQGVTDLGPEIAAANSQAVAFALSNRVLGQGVVALPNAANATGGDVLVGYLDPNNSSSTLVTNPMSSSLFNSVQVTAQRSPERGGVVPNFFTRLMGFRGSSIRVTSTATAQNYTISGFKATSNLSANLLPIVLDVNTYNAMMAGLSGTSASDTPTDQYSYNTSTGAVTSGPDGVPESKLYPVANGSPGNWGTIKVGVSNNSTSTLRSQITDGITPAQLATYPGGVIQLDSTQNPPSIRFSGNPGISAGISSALQSIIGKPVTIPIYDDNGGNGNNAWYRVIAFAGVRIVAVNFQGNPKYVIVQPATVIDPTAIPGQPTSWTKGGVVVLHLTR